MKGIYTDYKGEAFSVDNCEEAGAIGRLFGDWLPGFEIVRLLKKLAARDKAQVFELPPLKPARSFEETFSAQQAIKDHFIFDPRLL